MIIYNKLIQFTFLFLALVILPKQVFAHEPRLFEGAPVEIVMEPEISKVYYGKLQGIEHWYRIVSDRPFTLYLNILAPETAGAVTDTRVIVFKDEVTTGRDKIEPSGLLYELNYPPVTWQDYYEPFGGSRYLKGPEFKKTLPAGTYAAIVTRKGESGEGRYALAIGEREKFGPVEIVKALVLMPRLKKDYFDSSPWTAYFNRSGLYLGGVILILIVLALVLKKYSRKQK